MAGRITTTAIGVQDAQGRRGLVALGPNTRVKLASGFLATAADQLLFPVPPGPSVTGTWIAPSTRVFVGGVPAIDTGSAGLSFRANGTPVGPLTTVQPDPRGSGG